jgi:hypothetical protein
MIEKSSGPIPKWMVERTDQELEKNFSQQKNHNESFLLWPNGASSNESIRRVQDLKTVKDLIPERFADLRDLV